MNETQTLAVQALCELLDNPARDDWDELVGAQRAVIDDGARDAHTKLYDRTKERLTQDEIVRIVM